MNDDRALTYTEFDVATENLGAALLDLGLRPGDRAIFQMGSVIETVIALLACAKAGVVPVCTLPQHRANFGRADTKRESPTHLGVGA